MSAMARDSIGKGALVAFCAALAWGCSEGDDGGSGGAGSGGTAGASGGGGSGGGPGGSSSGYARQILLADTFEQTTDGALAGDAQFAVEFCGDAAAPETLKPVGTVVRVLRSLRYFACIGDLGEDSAELILTSIPSDQVKDYIPYAALFTYEDAAHPNLARPSKGASNFALLVINLLNDSTSSSSNSACRGSNELFDDLRIGTSGDLCTGIPSRFRVEGSAKYVDVTFPGGQQQSFELERVPFERPP